MTDLCAEDVVVRLTAPQILSSETLVAAGGGAGSRVAASSAAVELGRRLLLAARAGDTPQVLDLMAKGAPFTTDWLGTSPLHLAAGGAHADTCAVLLRAGVSRDARTKVERTALHLAAAAGHAAVARVLLAAGAAVDCRDMLCMTPLHWAAQRGHAETAAVLLAAGADPAAVSKFNKTPRSLALELRRPDLARAMDEAARAREAARSVQHLVAQQNICETPLQEPQIQTIDGIHRLQNVKTSKLKIEKEKIIKTDTKSEGAGGGAGGGAGEGAAAQLLRRHGITLLPADHSSTVLSALQSGRTVVLSDAGKLMLKESCEGAASKPAATSGVVLTATPVRSPPAGGVKVFTLNNKLMALPQQKLPHNKLVTPQHMQQVKLVQLSNEGKIVSPGKVRSLRRLGGAPQASSPGPQRAVPQVKIIMNKSNFTKLMANATRADATQSQGGAGGAGGAVDAGGSAPSETEALRAALADSRRALASVQLELRAARERLARYEPAA